MTPLTLGPLVFGLVYSGLAVLCGLLLSWRGPVPQKANALLVFVYRLGLFIAAVAVAVQVLQVS